MSSVPFDLYEEILKLNNSHKIRQITFTLYDIKNNTAQWFSSSFVEQEHFVFIYLFFYSSSYYFILFELLYLDCVLLSYHIFVQSKLSDCKGALTKTTYIANENSNIQPEWSNDWAVLWVLICMVHMIVCFYHILVQTEYALNDTQLT